MSSRNGLNRNKGKMKKTRRIRIHSAWLETMVLSVAVVGFVPRMFAAPSVDVVEATSETFYTERQWMGMLRPLRALTLHASVAGTIMDLSVAEGEMVEEGEPLMRIVSPELQARKDWLLQHKEALERDVRRWEDLAEVQAAGIGEVEQARLRLLEVSETLAGVEARLASGHLHAPVAGRVVALRVVTNILVEQNEVLLKLEEHASMGMRVRIPAIESRYFRNMDQLSMESENAAIGQIENIILTDDPLTDGYLQVEARVASNENAEPKEVTLRYRKSREAIVVPWPSVARDDDRHWVAVVQGDPPTIERRTVVIGSGRAAGVEVREGLEEGDKVLRFEPRSHPDGHEVSVPGGN